MIFLGAGASKIFGIKTLQDMTDDLIEKMRDKRHTDIIDEILESLKKFGLTPDFESIYAILDGLTNPRQAVRNSGAFTAYVCKDLEDIETHPEFKELLYDFTNYIYEECTIKPEVLHGKSSLYDRLFQTLDESGKTDTRHFSATGSSGSQGCPVGNTIATTNYDMSIELYHNIRENALADGFRSTNNPFVRVMDPTAYMGMENRGVRWLIKLHGAIWQFKQGDRVIKTIVDPKSTLCPIHIKVDEEMMIYPVGEKPILREPYYTFYRIFGEQKWTRMIAIGYSFRDDPVNIAISENLEKVVNSTLIVINPDAEKVIQNLGSSAEVFNSRIIRIPKCFGDENLFEKLDLAIKVDSWKRYQERVWKDFKEKL